jgi:3-isopropylmalate/(R)-2-methylmalate dehydratase small subunit
MTFHKLKGQAWMFGDVMDVDYEILPFKYRKLIRQQGLPLNEETTSKYVMTQVDPEFPKKVNRGDMIVAGLGMGYGHDHEQASMAIKGAGISAVICESANANFFRNSVWLALPVVECPGITGIVRQGDELEVDLASGTISNITTGGQSSFTPYPEFLLEMVAAGGLYPQLSNEVRKTHPRRTIDSPQE